LGNGSRAGLDCLAMFERIRRANARGDEIGCSFRQRSHSIVNSSSSLWTPQCSAGPRRPVQSRAHVVTWCCFSSDLKCSSAAALRNESAPESWWGRADGARSRRRVAAASGWRALVGGVAGCAPFEPSVPDTTERPDGEEGGMSVRAAAILAIHGGKLGRPELRLKGNPSGGGEAE